MHNDSPRPKHRRSLVEEIVDLDQELFRLLSYRCRLVAKTRRPKREGTGTDEVNNEKKIRLAWERTSAHYTGDQRLLRQLFSMLQELDLAERKEEDTRSDFNLAPQQRPVSVNIAGPGSAIQARIWIALAAAAGAASRIANVVITDPVVDLVKALNQSGAKLSWEGDCIISKQGSGLDFSDKVVFAGDETFNAYLLAFLALPHPGMVKFTGGHQLKLADLTPLRHFLPSLGARIAHMIPKSNGLPLRLESAGMLPDSVKVPAALPEEGLTALLLAAPAWGVNISIDLSDSPHRQTVLGAVLPALKASGADVQLHEDTLSVSPGLPSVPAETSLDIDPLLASYILALPAFTQGYVQLGGGWNSNLHGMDDAEALLKAAGITAKNVEEGVRSAATGDCALETLTEGKNLTALPAQLRPLALALASHCATASGSCTLPGLERALADLPEFREGADSFLTRLGLNAEGDTLTKPEGKPQMPAPWTCPDAWWAMAYALAAFKRPYAAGLRIANPGVITDLMPSFWLLYNGLPNPNMKRKPKESPDGDKPARRRIIAG
ncbi:3-phosphoshikimate 1-carboxyvinyltransferase [Oleidesulfovibrio sp.]|uniref:3-phosphoshikimate 1-carboxyvinyltransferase n=1 Tax=Oleidesulfovibrio sp. TaxID=2909707 RepID=UPI003A845530